MASRKWIISRVSFSTHPPNRAAPAPMTAERIEVPNDTVTAIMSERPRPWAVWANRSLPESFVPNQCSGDGGEEMLRKSGSSNFQAAQYSPTTARIASRTKITRPTTASLLRKNRRI